MPKIHANGLDVHYLQVGSGPDVIMIHGLTGNLAVWHFTTIPALREHYRVTTFDLRGHGRTTMPPTGYTTLHMAEDLRALMDALGIERAHLIGHSLGSDVALHFALLYPERVNRIVAIEAGLAALVHLRKRDDWPGWEEWAKGLERYGGITVPREHWHDVDYMLRASLKVPVIFGLARGLPRKEEHLLRLLDTTSVVSDYENMSGLTLEVLQEIDHPVLLIYGSESHYIGTHDALRATLPNAWSALLDGCEHFAPLQQPEELNKRIMPFLQQAMAPEERPEPIFVA